MAPVNMKSECPNCGSIWGPGSEEWQFQECDACGWPSEDCENFMRDEDDYQEDDYDQYREDNDPNDSRNL
jgi:hypothetical protein